MSVSPHSLPDTRPGWPAPGPHPSATAGGERADERRTAGEFGRLLVAVTLGTAFGLLLQKVGGAGRELSPGAVPAADLAAAKLVLAGAFAGVLAALALGALGFPLLTGGRLNGVAPAGLIFGVGFGLIAYGPAPGGLDTLTGVLGMVAGFFLFLASSGRPRRAAAAQAEPHPEPLVLLALIRLSPAWVVVTVVLGLALVLAGLEITAAR
ncbi:MAG TPA: hypothetical protein VIL46_12985 [Gemmataceae bacterium]